MRSSKAILLTASLLFAATTSIAQTPPPAPTLKVYSRETIVDTTVTDKNGNPVHGLLKPDFTLKEDNKPQPIRGFHEYTSQPAPAPPKLPPNVYTNLQPPPASDAINILLLDFANSAPVVALQMMGIAGALSLARANFRQHRVKEAAMKYLHSMPIGTRVAVLGMFHPGTIHIVQGVTEDLALLSAAIDTVRYDTDAIATNYESWCAQQEMRNRMTLESLDQIAADVAGIKGRKNLIWFGTGIPTITNPEARAECLADHARDLNKALGLLTAAQVTVFPVSARGLNDGDPFIPNNAFENLSMEAVAEATGGTAYYNNNDLSELMRKAIATGADYYTLTYVPPGTEYDGRHHTINLKLNLDPPQPGLHLTYRDGYYAEDPTKMTPAPGLTLTSTPPIANGGNIMRTAMSRSMPISTDLLFDVQVQPSTEPPKATDPPILGSLDPKLAALSSKNGKHLTRYSFEYVLPARQLTFAPTPEGNRKASLEFDIAVYDADDHLITSLGQSIKPTLTADQHQQLLKGPFRFFQQLDLPPGPLFLRIGILDATANKTGTLEIPLTVPKK